MNIMLINQKTHDFETYDEVQVKRLLHTYRLQIASLKRTNTKLRKERATLKKSS